MFLRYSGIEAETMSMNQKLDYSGNLIIIQSAQIRGRILVYST